MTIKDLEQTVEEPPQFCPECGGVLAEFCGPRKGQKKQLCTRLCGYSREDPDPLLDEKLIKL